MTTAQMHRGVNESPGGNFHRKSDLEVETWKRKRAGSGKRVELCNPHASISGSGPGK